MTKQEFIAAAVALYRVGNMGDSDNPARPAWINASTPSGVCSNLDRMFHDMVAGGVITAGERQAIYDIL